jgi:hypothetical protein
VSGIFAMRGQSFRSDRDPKHDGEFVSQLDECIGDLSPTEAGIRAVEQLMGGECPVWPFLVNLPA